jgi:hypothetical protein
MAISLVTGKNTGNFAPIPTRAVVKASQTKVLRPKFPGEETGNFSKAEQRIDLPHQRKLLRDQRKEQPTEERERDPAAGRRCRSRARRGGIWFAAPVSRFDEHKTSEHQQIMPDRAGFPTEYVLILEGTGALTPEMISAYSLE